MATKQNTITNSDLNNTSTDKQDETFDKTALRDALFELTSVIRIARDSAYLFGSGFAEEGERSLTEVLDDMNALLKVATGKSEEILDMIENSVC